MKSLNMMVCCVFYVISAQENEYTKIVNKLDKEVIVKVFLATTYYKKGQLTEERPKNEKSLHSHVIPAGQDIRIKHQSTKTQIIEETKEHIPIQAYLLSIHVRPNIGKAILIHKNEIEIVEDHEKEVGIEKIEKKGRGSLLKILFPFLFNE